MKPTWPALAVALLFVLAPVAAVASCNDRPGTPTNLVVTFVGGHINLAFINTAHDGHIWWDVEVRDSAGNHVGLGMTGVGGQYSKRGGSMSLATAWGMPPLKPNTTYCFGVRARDGAGTEGCVSQIWTHTCMTPPDPEIDRFCTQYADDAHAQAGTLQDRQLTGACALAGPRWLASWPEHHSWCMAARGDPNSANAPDFERNARNETLRTCGRPIKTTGRPKETAPPTPPVPPTPTVCAVNVLVTVEQCYNLDGTPSEYYAPGSTQALGCGTSDDEAVSAAKASLGILLDDEPAPGSCTFSKQVFGGVCSCSPRRGSRVLVHPPSRAPQASCVGDMKPDAAGRCACPGGTIQNGLQCLTSSGNGGSTVPPPATTSSDRLCSGNMVLDSRGNCTCPHATSWNGRQCISSSAAGRTTAPCPAGTTGTPPNCSPGSGGIGTVPGPQPPPPVAILCPRGTTGIYPNCQPTGGGNARPNRPIVECPSGTAGRYPNCRPLPRAQQTQVPATPVQSQSGAQTCPAGTRPLMHRGRLIRCIPTRQSCPRNTTGTYPNCTPIGSGGVGTTKPGDHAQGCSAGTRPLMHRGRLIRCIPTAGGTTKPGDSTQQRRECPPGTHGRYPRCRPDRATSTPAQPPESSPQQSRKCPPGTFGIYPRCRIRHVPGSTGPSPAGPTPKPTGPKSCPSGLSGPNCDRIIVR
jgi:hypothetical protein